MHTRTADQLQHFQTAVSELDGLLASQNLADDNVETELHLWLDGKDDPLPWRSLCAVTPDEWFFVTTLYGEMTLDGQRTHIRKYFPTLFVEAASRDIRNFVPGMPQYAGLRSRWMSQRLCKMSEILRERSQTMQAYTDALRQLERNATPENPMPAFDYIVRDHRATGWKTLSVFVRDCVGGNCFPIDSRVEKELRRHDLPTDERKLVSLSLAVDRNPRELARMFYTAGGER